MPTSTLSRPRLLAALHGPVTTERLNEALFASKAEATVGDADDLEVSVTPDRLDLLAEGGLAAHLDGALDLARGPLPLRRARASAASLRFAVDPSVSPLRPFLAGVVVRAPTGGGLDEGLLAEAVRFQELLHATVGRDRRAMSLGIYPARKLRSPIRYTLEPLDGVEFVPLGGSSRTPAGAFYAEHPYAQRFGPLGRTGDRCLTLRDARGTVLSLPPVLNSREAGEAAVGDRALLLESTGTRERAVRDGLGLLLVVFAARGWSVLPVPLVGPDGATPPPSGPLEPRTAELSTELARAVVGEPLTPSDLVASLGRARLGARRVKGGVRVDVPPWRPDLLASVDLAEEVVLARGLVADRALLPPSLGRGRRLPATWFRREVAALLLGLGFAQPNTTVLVAEASAARLGPTGAIRLTNPVSREYAVVRDRLLTSHLEVLARNTRHGYPQRFAEVAPVVVRLASAGGRAATRYHAGLVVAGEGAGFAEAAATVDYLLRAFDVGSVREPAEIPGTLPGRAAKVRVAGETVAELGEIDPRLLEELAVPVPAAWAEVDLAALGPLLARRATPK